jgi:hypothetical protein
MLLLYAVMAYVKNYNLTTTFLAYIDYCFQPARSPLKNDGCKKLRMPKSKKNKNKSKLNLTVREEQRNKLEQMASLESRSVSNLIEVMADERWERLAEQQGVAYAKTVAEAMGLKIDADNPADREKLRRAILGLVAERKMPK